MSTIRDIANKLEAVAPLHYQESYDNSGLQIGHFDTVVTGVLLTVDVTIDVLKEAKQKNCNLIVSHHPLIFSGIKKIVGNNYVQECVEYAIKNDIAIYACHTNMDKAKGGVSFKLAEKLGLSDIHFLAPEQETLYKLVTFVPKDYTEKVAQAIYTAGAGTIGAYDNCSYRSSGHGTFRANENCNPFCGEIGEYHTEEEDRLEIIVPASKSGNAINALITAHPYEEPAYDLIKTDIRYESYGLGCVGILKEPTDTITFLNRIKEITGIDCIRHSEIVKNKVQKIALCGGAGFEFIENAINAKVDMYLTGDIKYHQFFDANKKIILCDIGHYESEQFTKEIFFDVIYDKNINFALLYSENKTNPIKYL